ncbi:MAG: Calx-beta domain-containing protein, partial [Synechocystis sp.]
TGVFIDGSFNTGSANDNFQRLLLAGTYYVKVSAGVKPDFSGFTDTNYSLGLALASSQVLPTITIAATDASAGETATGVTTNPGSFTLTRTGNVTQALTVNYTIGGTGTKGTDYNNLTGTVSFAAGSATALVNITPIDDTLAEGNETVILTLAAGTGYTVGTANTGTVTIADNEVVLPTITIAATDGSAGETATGVTANPGSFTLTRTGNLTQALTVNYTIGGTGTKGTDYNNLTGTVSFAAGSATALVNITPIDDLIFEGNETVILTISSSTTYALGADTFSTIVINNTDPKGLADFLWDKGSTLDKIVLNLNNRGFDLLTIFDSLKWGVTKSNNTNPSYTEVAEALWVTESIDDARMLADLLWDEGASQGQIGQAMKYIGFSLETIADSVKRGVTTSSGTSLNDIDVAIALWNSGYTASNGLNSNKLADLLWDVGANPIAIGQAMKYLGLSLEIIAGATKWGITKADGTNLDYHQVAEALWNSGYSFGSRKLADLLWDNSASQQKIGQVFEYLDLSLEDIVDAVKWGITQTDGTNLNYIDAAIAVWNSGYGLDTRKIADLLWDEGASQQQIGQIFKYFNWDLETIADAMDDGVTKSDGTKLNYTDVAIALWNSGYTGTDGLNSSKLADLLWDEGASQAQIGQAMKYLGFSLAIIANAVDDGVTKSDGTSPNYTDVAIALWNSGYTGADGLNTRKLADLLWDEGGDQKAIGQAMKYLGLSLETIADAVKWGVTKSDGTNLNYNSVAEALWNSGHSIDSRKLADLLWDASASQSTIGQAMKYLGLSLEAIA